MAETRTATDLFNPTRRGFAMSSAPARYDTPSVASPFLVSPASFSWGATELWDASNPDINPQVPLAPGGSLTFLNYGNLAGVTLVVSSDATSTASLNVGSGGTGSFAFLRASGQTYKIRWTWNAAVQHVSGTPSLAVSGSGVTAVTWSSDNPAAITPAGNGISFVTGQSFTWIEFEWTNTANGFIEVVGHNGGWEFDFLAELVPAKTVVVSTYVDAGVERYVAINEADPADVIDAVGPIPSSWTPIVDAPASAVTSTPIDSSTAVVAEVLPSATGSGAILFYANEDVTNTATLAPASGEQLNGVVDATFSFSNYANGTQFRADDIAPGQWVVSVVGAAGVTPRNEVPIPATEVTLASGATTLLYNADPAAGQVAVYDGYFYDEGSTRHVFIPVRSDEDDLIALEVSANVIPAGASIESISSWTDNLLGGATSEDWNIGLVDGTTNQFFLNRIDAGSDQRHWTIHLQVKGAAAGQTVLAGMLVPTALSDIQVSLSATTNDAGATHYGFDETVSTRGGALTLSGTGSVQGLKAGQTYELIGNIQLLPPVAGNAEFRFVDLTNNATVGKGWEVTSATWAGSNASPHIGYAVFTPTTDCEVGIDFTGGVAGEISSRSTLSVRQLPTTEVVQPGLVTPVDAEDVLLDSIDLTLPASAGNHGFTLRNGLTWGDVKSTYEYFDIQATTNGGRRLARRVLTSTISDSPLTSVMMIYGGISEFVIVSANTPTATSNAGNIEVAGGQTLTSIEIRGVRAQQTIIPADAIPANNTGVADGDALIWNAAAGQYEPVSLASIVGGLQFSASKTTAQSLSASVDNVITGWTADVPSGDFDGATGLFTAPVAGNYRVSATTHVAGGTNPIIRAKILVDGGEVHRCESHNIGGDTVHPSVLNKVVPLTAGQTVSIAINPNAALSLAVTSPFNTFAVERV